MDKKMEKLKKMIKIMSDKILILAFNMIVDEMKERYNPNEMVCKEE